MHTRLAAAIGVTITAILGAITLSLATPAAAQNVEDTLYTAVTPCAVFDSRPTQGADDGFEGTYKGDKVNGVFTGTNKRTFQIAGTFPAAQGGGNTTCNIPTNAVAVHINIVAVNPLTAGNIVAGPTGETPPTGGIVNYQALTPSLNNSNASTIPLTDGAIDIYTNCGNNCLELTVDVRGVVLGYHTPMTSSPTIDDLQTQIDDLKGLLEGVTRDNAGPNNTDRLLFTGMNLQIVDGTGNTECTHTNGGSSEPCNGQGNLIIGYNEDPLGDEQRTGTHSLILGTDNDWTAYSHIVAGLNNTATGNYATVTGGSSNTANGNNSSVTGGSSNTAEGIRSSVSGGSSNTAEGSRSSVTGGQNNTANGSWSSVSGGNSGNAPGTSDWVAGSLFEDD